ncbi:hypothetical protein GIX45_15325, partial [Erwinia sp. CPCC 100877]|nr:hypothetical protein [Erwinia sp. CPCC 100877]
SATVTIRDEDGRVLGTTVADASGQWKYALSDVADGQHTWTAEVVNDTGNTAKASITLSVDTVAPSAPKIVSMTDDVGTIQGTVTESGGITDDPAPTFSGTADAGTTVTLYDGDSVLGSVEVDKDGNWSYTPTTNLVDGKHTITVTSTDAVGNESAHSPAWDFTLDTSVEPPAIVTNTTDEISGTAEPGATVTITDPSDGSETTVVADKDGNWSIRPNPLEPGDTGATVVVTDEAGNTNSTGVDGPADTTPPDNITSGIVNGSTSLTDDVEPVTGAIPDGGSTNDSRPTYSGKATDDIDHVNIYDDGKLIGSAKVESDGTWSFTPDTDLTDGEHSLTVSAVDKAGNEGPQTSGTDDGSWDFTVDTSSPDNISSGIEDGSISLTDDVEPVTGAIPDGGSTNDSRPTYSGKATDDIDHVNIYDGGKLIGSAKVESDGTWSFTPDTALSSGGHGLTVAAVDAAGNEGPQVSGTGDESWDFTLLTSAPAQPSIENVSDDYTQGEDADTGYLQKGQ